MRRRIGEELVDDGRRVDVSLRTDFLQHRASDEPTHRVCNKEHFLRTRLFEHQLNELEQRLSRAEQLEPNGFGAEGRGSVVVESVHPQCLVGHMRLRRRLRARVEVSPLVAVHKHPVALVGDQPQQRTFE